MNDDSILFYDVDQKKQFVFSLNTESKDLIAPLNDIRNLNKISLRPEQVDTTIISKLIQNNLGHIREEPLSDIEIALPPVYSFPNRMNTEMMRASREVIKYIRVVTIYMGGECKNNCAGCDNLYKQDHFCTTLASSLSKKDREIAISKIKGLANLIKINVIFSSVSTSSLCFVKELSTLGAVMSCFIHWKNLTSGFIDELISGEGVIIIKTLIDLSDITTDQLWKVINLQHQYKNNLVLVFCVTCEKDFNLLQDYYHHTIKENVEVRYVYKGNGKDHIIKHYLLDDNDLQQITTDNNRIFGNRELNYSLFGELVIFPDGTIHLNQNTEVIGTISDDWVEMLNNALNKPNPWLMTRNKTKPCSNCIYRDLCPPIRNLELYLGNKLACVDFHKSLPTQNNR
ncbi:MAG: hypothetical protein K6C37_03245 [Bacteroidales bacterium]|nr:hypothetical protein [Bacteroidales bacterium]